MSGLYGLSHAGSAKGAAAAEDFNFVQLPDTHWGFKGVRRTPMLPTL
jgi:hypothetical protein